MISLLGYFFGLTKRKNMSSKLWGGRFEGKDIPSKILDFTSSLNDDKILAGVDAVSSIVHAETLAKAGYVSKKEKDEIIAGLNDFLNKLNAGKIEFSGYEDVHSLVQAYVENKARDASKKMHTGRSRNEQIVNDVRLYTKEAVDKLIGAIRHLQKNLLETGEREFGKIIPGYTHINRAQPILFSHLILAYIEMLERDRTRLLDAKARCDISVMGSGAIAGSSLDLDRKFIAELLGFKEVSANSIDSVSDRDFMIEILSCLSIMAVHLSRMAEDMILYSSSEFGYLDMGEEFCTGSSLMPQKKNADVLELIRGRSSLVIGALNALLVLLKGLPHAYNRDLQEDKKIFFNAISLLDSELDIMASIAVTLTVKEKISLEKLGDEFIYATDIAEYLVRKGISFKEAHWISGSIVKKCIEKNINISGLKIMELKEFCEKFEEDIYKLLNAGMSIKMKKTIGSTNPNMVKKEIKKWKKFLSR
ncbi:argininosuccinate lyase [Candidatus Omnitrophus magneticus]|uniref:Argininosuccinate lyase n=1 Tax=Candidatus Omnitrophus magneticus TaxID=1609969 RepID=A0A0F0CSR4_9BACT|nr:argininosuccinate lyase [Candidatus Omnitrophus magneticus]